MRCHAILKQLIGFTLLLLTVEASATRRGIRVDQGNGWTFPYSQLGTGACAGSSAQHNRVQWRGFEFSGLDGSDLQPIDPNSGGPLLIDGKLVSFCQATTPTFTGPSSQAPLSLAGLVGPNADSTTSGLSYTYQNSTLTRGFQWEFFQFPDGFALVSLNGLVGTSLNATTNLRRGSQTLWSAANNAFDGEYLCFQDDTYLGLWSGSFSDESSACLQFIRNRPLPKQVVSRNQLGNLANNFSGVTDISGTGRFIAFYSTATNVVSNDTNGRADVFVFDRAQSLVKLASAAANGQPGNGDSYAGWLSSNGRHVLFHSDSTNLIASPSNSHFDVFLKDLETGSIELVSAGSTNNCFADAISVTAVQLVYKCMNSNGIYTMFLRNRAIGSTTTVLSNIPSISVFATLQPAVEVQFLVLTTSVAISPADSNNARDVYLYRLADATFERVSTSSSGAQPNGNSDHGSISQDGCLIAFSSFASNLVSGDTNAMRDIFVRNRCQGTTERVSLSASGQQLSDGFNSGGLMSADGRYVTFISSASIFLGEAGIAQSAAVVRQRAGNVPTSRVVATRTVGGFDFPSAASYLVISHDGAQVGVLAEGGPTSSAVLALNQPLFEPSAVSPNPIFQNGFE